MASDIAVEISGLDDLLKRMQSATPKLQKSIARRSARRAMNIVRDDARRRAKQFDDPSTRQAIFRNIISQNMSSRALRSAGLSSRNAVGMRVGVRGGARYRKDSDMPTYWRFVEFGTENQQAQPFLRPAMETNVQKVADEFYRNANLDLDEALKNVS